MSPYSALAEYTVLEADKDGLLIPETAITTSDLIEADELLEFLRATEPRKRFVLRVRNPRPTCGYCGAGLTGEQWGPHRRTHLV